MIKVKAFKDTEQSNTPSRDDYLIEENEKRSVWPIALLLTLSAVIVYLKSFFPALTEEVKRDQQQEASEGEQAPAPEKNTPAEEVEDDVTGSTDDRPIGSSNVVPISFLRNSSASPGHFLASDLPPIDFSGLNRNSVVKLHPAQGHDLPANGPGAAGKSGGDGGGGRGQGGGGGGGGDSKPRDDDEIVRNRPPRTGGPVRLQDVVGCQALFIPYAALLAGTVDPDGDPLMVLRVSASSGTLVAVDGGWIFTAAKDMRGNVALSYYIVDGESAVQQLAYFSVVDAPPIIGTDGDDHLIGTHCDDLIDARGGNDYVDALGGDDVIHGGSGDDYILAGAGNDVVYAGAGDDTVYGGTGNDQLYGEVGNDALFGEQGNDQLFGGDGNDALDGGDGVDLLYGGADNDVIYGRGGADTISGEDGDDIAFGGTGKDSMSGGSGNDTLFGEEDNDVIDGGDGRDTLLGAAGNDALSGDVDNDVIDGGDGHDTLYGGAGDDVVQGGAGEDAAFGGTGKDTMFGDVGDDTLLGEADDDDINGGDGADVLRGAAGDDTVRGDAGNDVVDGGEGDDSLDGGDGNDTLLAGAGDDQASGGSGNDVISDGGGCDDVDGGGGNDYVQAAADGASDRYSGGDGEDTLDYSTAVLSIVVDLGRGNSEGAQIGRDLISSFESVIGGQGDDDIIAGSGPVTMTGGAGRDRFEFQVRDDDHQPDLVRQITDFSIGDRLIVASYEIRYCEGEDVDDAIEDLFDDIYLSNSSDNGNRPIRFRFEENDEDRRTFVDLMNDDESQSTFSIELFGHHQFLEVTVGVT